MSRLPVQVDVVVVGAGTAGANVAGQFAARGRSVVLVDRRPKASAGAQWHNGVLGWQFEAAQVEPPITVEDQRPGEASHFFGPDGRRAMALTDSPVVRADMAALGRKLRDRACEAGVEIIDSSFRTKSCARPVTTTCASPIPMAHDGSSKHTGPDQASRSRSLVRPVGGRPRWSRSQKTLPPPSCWWGASLRYARFTAPGLALVGDAASQVFPAHGSGIGLGLMAGTMLAETAAAADDCGDESTLWSYQHRYQREHGGTLVAYQSLRRMTTELGTDGVARMIGAGLLSVELTRTGLDQRWQIPRLTEAPKQALRFARVPSVAATMAPRLARAGLLAKIGAQHPATVDVPALARWNRKVLRLLGTLPTP